MRYNKPMRDPYTSYEVVFPIATCKANDIDVVTIGIRFPPDGEHLATAWSPNVDSHLVAHASHVRFEWRLEDLELANS